MRSAKQEIDIALKEENISYEKIMQHLANLRPDMDAFFDKVTVQVESVKVRANRLNFCIWPAPSSNLWQIFQDLLGNFFV